MQAFEAGILPETKKELLKSQKELTEDLQGKLDKSNTELGEDISGKVGELLKYIKEVEKNVDTNTSTIIGLPKPKYYDEELEEIKKDVLDLQSLKTIVEEIKEKQTDYLITLNEVYAAEGQRTVSQILSTEEVLLKD